MKVIQRFRGILCRGTIGKLYNLISFSKYMKVTRKYYRKQGVNLTKPNYIHPTVYIDSHNYGLISIGDGTTISMNVVLLCHDYSITNALKASGYIPTKGFPHFEKEISIGNNCFIGANAMLLPGTVLGDNCIVGAGAIVKGKYPDNCIIVGNPAKVIANTIEWTKKKQQLKDWGT